MSNIKPKDQPLSKMEEKINAFTPLCDSSKDLKNYLKSTLDIDQLIAFEVDHCP